VYEVAEGLGGMYNFEFALLRTNKQVSLEALRSWRKNVFIRIETPWPHAGMNNFSGCALARLIEISPPYQS
jgi:hypothetical protein